MRPKVRDRNKVLMAKAHVRYSPETHRLRLSHPCLPGRGLAYSCFCASLRGPPCPALPRVAGPAVSYDKCPLASKPQSVPPRVLPSTWLLQDPPWQPPVVWRAGAEYKNGSWCQLPESGPDLFQRVLLSPVLIV